MIFLHDNQIHVLNDFPLEKKPKLFRADLTSMPAEEKFAIAYDMHKVGALKTAEEISEFVSGTTDLFVGTEEMVMFEIDDPVRHRG